MNAACFLQVGGARISDPRELAALGIEIRMSESPHELGTAYNLALVNTARRAVLVESAGIIYTPEEAPGSPLPVAREWRVFLDQGQCGWCGVKRLETLGPDPHLQPVEVQSPAPGSRSRVRAHRSDLQAVAWDAASGEAMLVGFLRQRHGVNSVDIVPGAEARDIAAIVAWQELGFEIDPGAEQPLDTIVRGASRDPYCLLEGFAEAVRDCIGRRFDAPPIVGMMTWYGYRTAIDEEIIRANLAIIAELFSGYPQPLRNVMLLDHGWQEDANWGFWAPDSRRFPSGMRSLAEEARRLGIELGLWYTPFCITENAPNLERIRALRALDEKGTPYGGIARVWGDLPSHSRDSWPLTFFDGARDEVQSKWREELADMKEWGARYWKLDFFSLRSSAAARRRLGTGELYARTWRTFREAVGSEGHLAPCSCRTNIQLGYNDSVRVASDIGNAGHWPGAMEGFRYGMATIAALWYKNRRFWINDPDSIQVAKGCSLSEARVRATVVAMSGGHLMLSEDLRHVDGERLEIVRRILPPYSEAARPLDLFDSPFPEGYPSLWALASNTGFGRVIALALFNLSDRHRRFTIEPSMLGIAEETELIALEWWQQRWLGRFAGPFEVEVPAEDVAVVHARPCSRTPSLVSVSHHITGGWIVEEAAFDQDSGMLTGTVATKAGLHLVLFGYLPPGWAVARQATYHGAVSSIRGWQHELTTTGKRTRFAVAFERE